MKKAKPPENVGAWLGTRYLRGNIMDHFSLFDECLSVPDNPKFGDDYRLIWRKPETNIVGEIRNYTLDKSGYRRIQILFDDNMMKKIKMRFLVSHWPVQGPEIIVSKAFMAIPKNLGRAGIWHEVGHIHHEHLLCTEFCNQVQYKAARMSAVEQGTVLSFEAQADQFAIKKSGKEAIVAFLEYIHLTRPTGTRLNDIGKKELELRIEAILAYNSVE